MVLVLRTPTEAPLILIAFHKLFHNCPPPFSPNGDPFLSFVASCLLLYDIDFIHNSLPPILGRASVGVRKSG